MRPAAIVVLCAMMAACAASNDPSAPDVALDRATQVYLEGGWATHCGDDQPDPDEGYDPSFSIEFQRSGGSIFYDDGIDGQLRGRIVAARRESKGILLEIVYGGPTDEVWLRPAGRNRLELSRDSNHSIPLIFRKCDRPDRKPVSELSTQAIMALTLGDRRAISFAEIEGAETACPPNPKSWLLFDLIGPVGYSAWRHGASGDEWLKIQDSSENRDEIILSGVAEITSGNRTKSTHKEKRTLHVRWLDQSHIRVEPWNKTFLRCDN